MGPINYMTDVQTPFATALQGYQAGAAIRNDQAQQQQQQQAALAQQQMQQDLGMLAGNKAATGADYAAVMTRYPQLSEQLGRSWKALNETQQQSKLDFGTRAYAAMQGGRVDIAEQLFRDRAAAARNGGAVDEAKQAETMADLIKLSPESARTSIALSLSSFMGPEKFADTFAKLGGEQRAADKAPIDLRTAEAGAQTAEAAAAVAPAVQAATRDEAVAKAATAQVTAQFANQNAVLDLQKKGWDIKAIEADMGFKREANRIAAMNAAANREGNALKREELGLRVQEARSALDGKIREKVATAEAGAANIDNMLNTVQRILKNPSLNSVVGSLEGKEYYPNTMAGTLNPFGDGDERADAIALIETLGSQAFLAQIPSIKGMGALSNAEGDKLQSALQNLKRAQSEKGFRESLNEASRLLLKGRENLSKSTGVPLPKPDTPAAPGARPPLDSFFK